MINLVNLESSIGLFHFVVARHPYSMIVYVRPTNEMASHSVSCANMADIAHLYWPYNGQWPIVTSIQSIHRIISNSIHWIIPLVEHNITQHFDPICRHIPLFLWYIEPPTVTNKHTKAQWLTMNNGIGLYTVYWMIVTHLQEWKSTREEKE